MIAWSHEQAEQWRHLHRTYVDDTEWVQHDKDVDTQRPGVQREMLDLLHAFLDGTITLKTFNAAFQQKTRDRWKVFHLRGMSGGLFLNKLVKYVPSEETFGSLFRLMIRLPEDTVEGQRQMQAFLQLLEGLITSHQVTRAQVQPARVPFFLSAWWHVQEPERWPIFYLDVRRAVLSEAFPSMAWQDPVEAYFAFRTRFLALAEALGITSWQLEHLVSWYTRRNASANGDEKKQPPLSQQRRNPSRPTPEASLRPHQPGRGQEPERVCRLAWRERRSLAGAPGFLSNTYAVAAREAGTQGGLSRLDCRQRSRQRVPTRTVRQPQPFNASRLDRHTTATDYSTD